MIAEELPVRLYKIKDFPFQSRFSDATSQLRAHSLFSLVVLKTLTRIKVLVTNTLVAGFLEHMQSKKSILVSLAFFIGVA